MIPKGTQYKTTYNKDIYEVVGRWNDSYVLASQNEESDHVLIYSEDEIKELEGSGELKKLK